MHRFSIATSILEAQNLDMWNLFFGGGFGASRPGTHNFVLDIFVDTGLVGSTLFLITMGYLIITVYKKDARNLEFIALYSSLICVCLIKSLLASNTYSEPLLATLLAITLTKFFATKLRTETK